MLFCDFLFGVVCYEVVDLFFIRVVLYFEFLGGFTGSTVVITFLVRIGILLIMTFYFIYFKIYMGFTV